MEHYLTGNNAISGFFSATLPSNGMDFMAEVFDQTPNISVITEIEALSWVDADKNKERIVQIFVKDANVLGLTPDIVARCIKLRRGRKMRTPDAIIAATALVHNLTLITHDSGFDNIEDLRLIDPHKL